MNQWSFYQAMLYWSGCRVDQTTVVGIPAE